MLLHTEAIPAEYIADFVDTVRTERLELLVQSRPSRMPFAAIEWLMPTAIVAYLAKPYFDSFLKEMGKDHYGLLKDGLNKMYGRVAGPKAPDLKLVSSAGKVDEEQQYSLFFSIVVEGLDSNRFKLLIPRPITESEYELAVSEFLEFAARLHSTNMDQQFAAALTAIPQVGGEILVVYDFSEKKLQPIHPLARHRR